MVVALTYNDYVTQLAQLVPIATDDANFTTILPQVISYAELRMCQDLDFLSTVSAQTGFSTSSNVRTLTFPLTTFITLQEVNIITPVGVADPTFGVRNPCTPSTKEYLDYVWPSATGAGTPNRFAMLNQNTIIFGPWPDSVYAAELVGTTRPDSLSSSNTSTFISTYLPGLFLMASMIYISAWQRNFSSMSDDQQMGATYEKQYQEMRTSAFVEEARKKWQGSAWSSMGPPIAATPPTRG
jgi:hypothetical protein